MGVIARGLVQGSLVGINTLGLVLLWRTTRVVNLAQPAMGMVGGVLVGLLVSAGDWSFWWAAPIGLAVGALMGLAAERLVLVRLQDVPRAVLLVATVGLAQIFGAIQTALPFMFGGPLPSYTIDLGVTIDSVNLGLFTIDLFPVRLLGPHVLALLSLPLALVALYWFLHRTRLGLAACALGQDAQRARALGVPAASVRSMVWAVAGALSALSGMLTIPVLGFGLEGAVGPMILFLALAPAVIAGLRSLPGAAFAALAIGVGYQVFLQLPRAGIADLFLAVAIVAAIAVQGRRLGRAEAAARASSWEAATAPRPLSWAVASSPRVRGAAAALATVGMLSAALLPLALTPSGHVLYATSAALALGTLGVAVAWMFAGEISLGHWGFAGLGAAVAAVAPGPWPVRCAVAGLVMLVAGGALGLASRRQSSLSFAVLSLAAAVAAQVAVLAVGRATVPAEPGIVGAVGGFLVVAATIAVVKLRSSALGVRMVAARDDPQRAPWLGVDTIRTRVLAIGVSTGLAGLAGALYLASTPAGIAPGAFDAARSLDVLAMAVVGGLGSPVGAMLGAGGIQAARLLLPTSWAMLASGAGILIVVLTVPAGLARIAESVRTVAVRMLVPAPPAKASRTPEPVAPR